MSSSARQVTPSRRATPARVLLTCGWRCRRDEARPGSFIWPLGAHACGDAQLSADSPWAPGTLPRVFPHVTRRRDPPRGRFSLPPRPARSRPLCVRRRKDLPRRKLPCPARPPVRARGPASRLSGAWVKPGALRGRGLAELGVRVSACLPPNGASPWPWDTPGAPASVGGPPGWSRDQESQVAQLSCWRGDGRPSVSGSVWQMFPHTWRAVLLS